MTESGKFTLTRAERAVFGLRALYESRGYERFKVNKFEEYDFYAGCKSFLTSESVLTFTDSTGRLMALKPDVTLSIVKNAGRDGRDVTKVYYNESVYRDYGDGNGFREITQTGLECIGAVDAAAVGEAVSLAGRSLDVIASGRKTLLAVSHMGVVSGILRSAGADPALFGELLGFMEKRNSPEIRRAAAEAGLPGDAVEKLIALSAVYGSPDEVRDELYSICGDDAALDELFGILGSLDPEVKEKIKIDFSVGG
ncbi:MAG: ATP phosphoribosyltransferase regulatory subunit, partial [Clostridia bacterium]|nr:ATP phosphoribosyltransferase regulatory subunit [Clostridia bacterium]